MPNFPASKWGSQDFSLGVSDSKAHVLRPLRILQMRRGYKRNETIHPGRARKGVSNTESPASETGGGMGAEGG